MNTTTTNTKITANIERALNEISDARGGGMRIEFDRLDFKDTPPIISRESSITIDGCEYSTKNVYLISTAGNWIQLRGYRTDVYEYIRTHHEELDKMSSYQFLLNWSMYHNGDNMQNWATLYPAPNFRDLAESWAEVGRARLTDWLRSFQS